MDTPKKIGRYEILEALGHGAMGTVYRAKDPSMDRVVAVKTIIALALASEQGSEFRERFFREARAAGGLAHPGIVPVFDVGEEEGLPYLVMEYVAGQTLANAAKRGERLSIERVCEIGQKVAEALGYAHQRGVVHRDIKPANILLTSVEAYGIERPKITDFGVAKLAIGNTTVTGQIVGTPAFMPPEQFTGNPIDGRADLFSLGVVMYWMATGEQPFPGESVTAVSYKVVHTDPVPPSKLNPAIPAKLQSIIMRCLAKSPADRYQTGEELAQDLKDFRGGAATVLPTLRPSAANDPDATLVEYNPRQSVPPHPGAASAAGSQAPGESVVASSPAGGQLSATAPIAPSWVVPQPPTVIPPSAPAASHPSVVQATAAPAPPQPPAPLRNGAPRNGLKGGLIFAAIVIAIVLVAGVLYARRTHKSLASMARAVSPAAVVPAPPKPAEPVKRPPKKEAEPPAPIVTPPVDFDPKTLDAKENARLRIDDKHVAPALAYAIEMNGKLYFQKTAGAAVKIEDEKLFVPPGVQEFRVKAANGDVQKVSNTVSADFRAKKKLTLKVELRTQGASPGADPPSGLYTDTQIFITLK